jgi:hypothetical protein
MMRRIFCAVNLSLQRSREKNPENARERFVSTSHFPGPKHCGAAANGSQLTALKRNGYAMDQRMTLTGTNFCGLVHGCDGEGG